MTDIGKEIRTLTLADSDVSNLVDQRMHTDAIPQDATLPAISFRVIDTVPNEGLTAIINVAKARIEINALASDRGTANLLSSYVRVALHQQFRGDNSGTYIHEINLASGESYFIERAEEGTDIRRFVTTQDFFVTYRI